MSVFAYLDPGSGSMLLQVLLGGIAGIAVSIKMFGKRVFRTLAFWKRDEEPERAEPETEPATERERGEGAVKETV